MFGKDLKKYNATFGATNPAAEGYVHHSVAAFCELLNEADAEGLDGKKYEFLCGIMKQHLRPEVYETYFGFAERVYERQTK